MALEQARGTFTLTSGDTGTKDVITGLSFQPKIVFFEFTWEGTGTGSNNGISHGWGAATATDEEWSFTVRAEDNRSTTDCARRGITDGCIICYEEDTDTVDYEYSFNSFLSDGVRLNVVNAPDGTKQVAYWVLGGSDLEDVIAFNFQIDGDGGTGSKTVNFPAGHQFEPDAMILASFGNSVLDANTGDLHFSWGITDFTNQYTYGTGWNDGSSASSTDDINQYWTNQEVMCRCNIDGGTPFRASDCVATSTGFTWTIDQAPGGSNDWYVFGIAIKGPQVYAGHFQMATSITNVTVNDAPFTPSFIFSFGACWDELVAPGGSDRNNCTFAIGWTDTAGAADGNGYGITADDGGSGGDTECETWRDTDHFCLEVDPNGARTGWGQINSWETNGFIYRQLDAANFQEYVYYLVIGPKAAVADEAGLVNAGLVNSGLVNKGLAL